MDILTERGNDGESYRIATQEGYGQVLNMAGNIKGITIEIGGNTTPLQKALSGVNKSIKDTQKQLKRKLISC